MKNESLVKRAAINALSTGIYVTLVAWFMTNVSQFVGNKMDGFFGPAFFLLLLVVSASVTGGLVLGKPVLLYLDGKKKEAVLMFLWTIGFLVLLMIIVFFGILIHSLSLPQQ